MTSQQTHSNNGISNTGNGGEKSKSDFNFNLI